MSPNGETDRREPPPTWVILWVSMPVGCALALLALTANPWIAAGFVLGGLSMSGFGYTLVRIGLEREVELEQAGETLAALCRYGVRQTDGHRGAWEVYDRESNATERVFSVRTTWINGQPHGPEFAALKAARLMNDGERVVYGQRGTPDGA